MGQTRDTTEAVQPLRGLAPWVGGKCNLAGRINARLEQTPHQTYAEPFIGMGGVFFRRRRRPKAEAINDRSGEVVNLFRVVKHHVEAFLDELDLTLSSRRQLELFGATAPESLTDIQRAARFWWMQRLGYGGRLGSTSFPVSPLRARGLPRAAIERQLRAAYQRLATVTIENLPYGEFIERYDRPTTLFYLDPPYWGCETLYGKGLFERADFARIADQLRGIRGRFLLSINDRPEIREIFDGFSIEEVPVIYRTNGVKWVTELLIEGPPKRRSGRHNMQGT